MKRIVSECTHRPMTIEAIHTFVIPLRVPAFEERPAMLYKLLANRVVCYCAVGFTKLFFEAGIFCLQVYIFSRDYTYPVLCKLEPFPLDDGEGQLSKE